MFALDVWKKGRSFNPEFIWVCLDMEKIEESEVKWALTV